MANMIHYLALFVAKVADNALGTSKTIFIQRSKWILAGISVVLSDYPYKKGDYPFFFINRIK